MSPHALSQPGPVFGSLGSLGRSLLPRQSPAEIGYWPLVAITCPSDTIACKDRAEQAIKACCPLETECVTESFSGGLACCPTTGKCHELATSLPLCQEESWTLYKSYNSWDGYFCCRVGERGFHTEDKGDACGDLDLPVQSPADTVGPQARPTGDTGDDGESGVGLVFD